MPQFAVQMRQISKIYDGFQANKKINFNLRAGSIHAVAGENGAGKSTLMKVLFGLEKPYADHSPEIIVKGEKVSFDSPLDAIRAGIGMVQQHFALSGALCALDNIILGAEPFHPGYLGKNLHCDIKNVCLPVNRAQARKKLEELAQKELGVAWEEAAENLPVGHQQRMEILKLLFRNADILILDEPTGVLTVQEVESFFRLLKKLKEQGKSIIIITHKLDEIFSICDEVTVLRQGELIGSYETKNITKDQLIEAMIGRPFKALAQKQNIPQIAKSFIEVHGLTLKKLGRGSIHNLNFEIRPGEILGIAGIEGNGQQALVEALMGLEKAEGHLNYKGEKIIPHKTNVRKKYNFGLISEDRHRQSLWLDESIKNNCILGRAEKFSTLGFMHSKEITSHAEHILSFYDVKMRSVDQKVRFLSGGNQQKVVVAREIKGKNPDFLVVCQPTRGVDVGAIELIHESLLKKAYEGAAILLISSELEEICRLSDRIMVLTDGHFSAAFEGPKFDFHQIGAAMISKSSGGII